MIFGWSGGYAPPSIVVIAVAKQMLEILSAIKHAMNSDNHGGYIHGKSVAHAAAVTFDAEIGTNIVALVAALWKCRERQATGDNSADIFSRPRLAAPVRDVSIEAGELAFRARRKNDSVLLR